MNNKNNEIIVEEIINKPWKFTKNQIINKIKEFNLENQDVFNYSLNSNWNKDDISINSLELINNIDYPSNAAIISGNFYSAVLKNKDLLTKDFIIDNLKTIYYTNNLIC